MAVYYIDYVSGADTNNGTVTATPFQHCPGDDSATDTAAATTLVAGDTVVFEGGVTYVGQIDCDWSGSDGSPITYISGHRYETPWGSSSATLSASGIGYSDNTGAPFNVGTRNYITIDGFTITNVPSGDYMGGVYVASDGSTDATGHIIQYLTVGGSSIGIYCYGGATDTAYKVDTVTIDNCTLTGNYREGMLLRGRCENFTITNNTIHDNTGNQADGIQIANVSTGVTTTATISGNVIYNHPDKSNIILEGADSITIEKNTLYGTVSRGAIDVTGPGSDNLIIRNNVMYINNSAIAASIIFNPSSDVALDGIDIYNNTIVPQDTTNYQSGIDFDRGASTSANVYTNVNIKNNIINMAAGGSVRRAIRIEENSGGTDPCVELATLAIDYNRYHGPTNQLKFDAWSLVDRDFSDWQNDVSDETNSSTGDPGVDSNYYPNDGAAVIDSGVDLTAEGFADDKDGVERPQGVAWDIGAYEYRPGGGLVMVLA